MFFKSLTCTALVATASAHMVLKEPKPFATNNSPLNEDGSNYPCKVTSFAADSRAEYPLGSTQKLSFTGSAVHGGGSCQVAITYDKNPTKQSVFKVIHSIEGGCPAKNLAGNLPANPSGDAPDTYPFKIPEDLPTGEAILSWTWFNRIGNREMYMNCAPIKITGSGKGSMAAFEQLPDIMIANIGGNQCKVPEGTDVKFPNPGKSVSSFAFNGKLQELTGQPACAYNWMAGKGAPATPPATGGGNGGNAPTTPKPGYDESPATPSKPGNGAAPSAPGGVFLPVPSASAAPPAPSAPAAPAPPAGGNQGCTDGTFMCTGTSYKQCSAGQWTLERPLAAGTRCTPGVGNNLNIIAARSFQG